jgi:hypothetical protein
MYSESFWGRSFSSFWLRFSSGAASGLTIEGVAGMGVGDSSGVDALGGIDSCVTALEELAVAVSAFLRFGGLSSG